MKRISAALFVAAVLTACEEKNETVIISNEPVTLEVRIPSAATRVTSVGNEEAVSSYQIFVYSLDSGMLEAYTVLDGDLSSTKLKCTTGSKEIVVLANAPDLKSAVSLSSLKTEQSKLEHNAAGALVMEGSKTAELTASSTVDIDIKRMASRICLKSIRLEFDSDVYAAMDFKVLSAYLINVPADKKYLAEASLAQPPQNWYNMLAYDSDVVCPELLKDDINVLVSSTYNTEHVFYCYPNPYVTDDFSDDWSCRPTRLVVEAELGGVLYYYPVSLPELKQNTAYDVSLVVTRPGKTDVNDEVKKYDETFNIDIVDWYTGDVLEEIL